MLNDDQCRLHLAKPHNVIQDFPHPSNWCSVDLSLTSLSPYDHPWLFLAVMTRSVTSIDAVTFCLRSWLLSAFQLLIQ